MIRKKQIEQIPEILEKQVMEFQTAQDIKKFIKKFRGAKLKFSGWVSGKKQHFYARCSVCPYYLSWSKHTNQPDQKIKLVSYKKMHIHDPQSLKKKQKQKLRIGEKKVKKIRQMKFDDFQFEDEKKIIAHIFDFIIKKSFNEDIIAIDYQKLVKQICEEYKISENFGKQLINLFERCLRKRERDQQKYENYCQLVEKVQKQLSPMIKAQHQVQQKQKQLQKKVKEYLNKIHQ